MGRGAGDPEEVIGESRMELGSEATRKGWVLRETGEWDWWVSTGRVEGVCRGAGGWGYWVKEGSPRVGTGSSGGAKGTKFRRL